jgi:hypothetical protein
MRESRHGRRHPSGIETLTSAAKHELRPLVGPVDETIGRIGFFSYCTSYQIREVRLLQGSIVFCSDALDFFPRCPDPLQGIFEVALQTALATTPLVADCEWCKCGQWMTP